MNLMRDQAQDILPWGDTEYIKNPYPWYETARKDWPIYRSLDGTFVVTRYDDVVKFGKLPSLSIVDPEWVPKGPWAALSTTVLGLDPPQHTEMRRRGNKWFTPKLVKEWSKIAEAFVRNQIATLKDHEVFDANMYLGVGPTHSAMCGALQLPADDFEPVIFSMHGTMAALSAEADEEVIKKATEAFDYQLGRMRKMLEWKRVNPGTGMADALLEAESKGEMTSAEVEQTLALFWASGGHNPSYIISSAIQHFARHPEIYEIYRSKPELRTGILNEIFRLYPPELSFARWVREPLEIQGQTIEVGERVKFIIDSANRDPEAFPNPDVLDMNRAPEAAMNVSFGMGPHQCAGQIISRTEVEVVLDTLAELVERFEIRGVPEMDNTDRSRAYVNLPISIVKVKS
ncbi:MULTISPECIES: cytochrome P450 [unclassified Mesorhizobium]|uniref:cytochrome P450 n=1 Tax=unclassified Mesorhizobium TaxID=325217 RepID=UPI00143F9B8C|nr:MULTISPECIES: cytochrome P450 [unclassified Mesorhizobium]